MFTGIIDNLSKLITVYNQKSGDKTFLIQIENSNYSDIKAGESIACNGVCLTVIDYTTYLDNQDTQTKFIKKYNLNVNITNIPNIVIFAVSVSAHTLTCTNLKYLEENSYINTERSLLASDRISGHIVSGHVDNIADIVNLSPVIPTDASSMNHDNNDEKCYLLQVKIPNEFSNFIVKKGSITLDGISLTINDISKDNICSINILQYTFDNTNISNLSTNDKMNFEVDIMARYINKIHSSTHQY